MGKILFGILFLNILCSYVQTDVFPKRSTESFIVHYLEDRRIVSVRIELNAEQQTEYVLSSKGGETLYDFNQGKVAYKDTNSSQCFIADITEESLEGDRKRLRNLRNGIVRGFYLPTFIIQEEFINGTQLLLKFGDRLTQFCKGNIVSSVAREQQRRKRDTSEEKGQFTHHSYGHYGHQSNNYAHYGHETYLTGSVDKDGQIRNQRASHQQVRSESSQGYPDQSFRNVPQVSTRDSTMGISSPQSQTQYQMPNYQQTFDGIGRNFGTGGSGQFSLQTAQESGYQLNLPMGLRAGNIYRGGIRSAGHYGVGGSHPQIATEYQKYPSSIHSTPYRPGDQTSLSQISPPVSSISGIQHPSKTSIQPGLTPDQALIRHRTTVPGYRDLDQDKITHKLPGIPDASVGKRPTLTQPGIYTPISPTVTGEHVDRPRGAEESGIQTDSRIFIPSGERQPGVSMSDYESQDKKYVDQRITPNGHRIPSRTDHSALQTTTSLHPGPRISATGIQTPVFQPGISMPSMLVPGSGVQTPWQPSTGIIPPGPGIQPDISVPSIHRPGSTIPGSLGLPGQISTGLDASGIHPDLRQQQRYIPSRVTPGQQFVQTPSVSYPSTHGIDRDIGTRSQVPVVYPPAIIPGYPGAQTTVPRTLIRSDQTTRNGIRYPDSLYYQQPQSGIGEEYLGAGISPRVLGIPGDIRGTSVTGVRPEDMQFFPRGTGPIPPESGIRGEYPGAGISPRVSEIPGDSRGTSITSVRPSDMQFLPRGTEPIQPESTRDDRRIAIDRIGHEGSRLYGQDAASSQTQIQTGAEGTAAEAAAAGEYRGLGSQTQVQGGYAGNGSFSAQAQSGFTGGVVQSQVQGSKLGGLSGSSAQVERVGSAQSQVQVGQPSGAASSSAQGRFSGGTTQVQAQSGKSGGSAGAQAQSTGLSSSHVQVNIGGQDVKEKERFQGTVSASVHGGHSSGQSQTQMQGGYESGRTYVATAQGGFDSSLGLQVAVPPVGSLTRLSNHTLRTGHPSSVRSQGPLHTVGGMPSVSSPTFRMPTRSDLDEKQISRTTQLSSRDQTAPVSTGVYTHPSETQPDQRHLQSGRFPQQQLPPAPIPQQTLFPPSSHTQESRIQHPTLTSEIQRPQHVYPSSTRYPYPGYQTGVTGIPPGTIDEKQIPTIPEFPGYRRYDRGDILPSGITPDSQQIHTSHIPGHQNGAMQPSLYVPGTVLPMVPQRSHIPGFKPDSSQDSSYPSSIVPTSHSQRTTDQQYIAGIPVGYPGFSQQPSTAIFPQIPHSTTFESGYIPSYPSSSVPQLQTSGLPTDQMIGFRPGSLPGFKTDQYHPSSLFPGQPQISSPSSQTIPSYIRPGEIPLPRPDATHQFGQQPSIHRPSTPEQSQIRPIQPQISPTSSVSAPGIPASTTTTDITGTSRPAVSEPDINCCEALRDLKRRCCDKTSKKDTDSSCCKSTRRDDTFDFISEDDLDESSKSDEPCKIVKAICYIVYKPIGKARVCKPTQTNGC